MGKMKTPAQAKRDSKKRKAKKLYSNPNKQLVLIAARNQDKLAELRKEAAILRLVKKGNTFEEVAQIVTQENEKVGEPGISPHQALALTKQAINRWCGELALDAKQAKELDLKRIDALMVILWNEIEPRELKDEKGRPVLDAATLEPALSRPDYNAIKLFKDLLERRARMLGLDADESAVKITNEVNIIERRYVGADPDVL